MAQGSLQFLLMGTWEHEQIFQRNLRTKWILGSNLEFLLGEQSRNIFGDKGDFGYSSREHRNTDPPGVSRNLLNSGNFPERTIGNSGYFSDSSPDQLSHLRNNVTAPLNLKSSFTFV